MSENTQNLGDFSAPETFVSDLADQPRGFLRDEHLVSLERWLDAKFKVPGTSFHFGLDGLIGLIPGAGDLATTALSGLFIADAWKMGARKRTLAKMGGNVLVDSTIGAIPVIGDIFDFMFRSNTKNLALLKSEREHLRKQMS